MSETTPHEKVDSLLQADLLGDFEEETPTIPPWRTEESGYIYEHKPQDIKSIELEAIEDCLIHVKDTYQGETFDSHFRGSPGMSVTRTPRRRQTTRQESGYIFRRKT